MLGVPRVAPREARCNTPANRSSYERDACASHISDNCSNTLFFRNDSLPGKSSFLARCFEASGLEQGRYADSRRTAGFRDR